MLLTLKEKMSENGTYGGVKILKCPKVVQMEKSKNIKMPENGINGGVKKY